MNVIQFNIWNQILFDELGNEQTKIHIE